MQEHEGEAGAHFEHVHLDAGFDLHEVARVPGRDERRRVLRQAERFKVAGVQGHHSIPGRRDPFSIPCDRNHEDQCSGRYHPQRHENS
ncbi:MAG: hypothetical protein OXG82_20885 [Gammaproteobacteria bacterium]|nr:hypothetical protein [Gammaproteobacteria bacterium]